MTEKKQELRFEDALVRLEEIVRHLLYEEGTGLIKACSKMLDQAEQKVVKLKKGPDRSPIETDFEDGNQYDA